MSADGFEVGDRMKLTVDELRHLLSSAFDAGCEVGFKGGLEGAREAVKANHCENSCHLQIDDVCGPNGFAVMIAFEKWLKKKGGK